MRSLMSVAVVLILSGCAHGEDIRVRVRDNRPILRHRVVMVPAVVVPVAPPSVTVEPAKVASGAGMLPTLTAREKASSEPAAPPRTRILIEKN